MRFARPFAVCALSLACCAAQAFDFKTVGAHPVILYDAPSSKGGKLYIAPSGMPVEVLLSYGDWVIVRAPSTRLRASPDEAAPTLLIVDRNVLLELVDPEPGPWVRVRHRDGVSGYVRASDVWGN
jgi:SH3-like domain-containing protein